MHPDDLTPDEWAARDAAASDDDAPVPPWAGRPVHGGTGGSRRFLLALAVVTALALVVAVISFLQARDQQDRADGLASTQATERDVSGVAAAFGEALLSYDRNDLAGARARVAETATDSFLDTYDETFQTLEPVITQLDAVGVGQAETVYLADVGDDTAKAVVVLNQRVRSTAGSREADGVYLQVDLVREDGRWKVLLATRVGELGSALSPIGTPGEDEASASTTTTGVPDTTSTSAPG